MKKTFITAAMLAAAIWIAPKVNAEGGNKSILTTYKVSADPRHSVVTPDAAELAKKNQVELYRGADGQVWETGSDKQTVCTFSLNSIRHRAVYDKKGNWRWTVKSYQGLALNEGSRNSIVAQFGDVNIEWVDEVSMPNDPTNYFVVISTDKRISRVRVVGDKVDTIEDFAKN